MAQLNYNDFANQVKKKLPEYASMDNLSLARKIEAEYPQYKGKIAYPEKLKISQSKNNSNQYMSPARPQQLQSSTNPEAYMSKLQGNPNDINSRLGVQGAINNARQPIQDLVDQATMPVKSASQLKFEAAMNNQSPAQYTQNLNAGKMVEDELARRAAIKQNNVVENELKRNPVTPLSTAVDTVMSVPKGAVRGMSTSAAQGIGALEQMIPIQAVQEHGKSITDFYENEYNNPNSFLYKALGVPMKYQQGGMFDNPANALVNLGSAAGEMAPILLSGAIGGKAATKAAQKMLPSITEKRLQNAGSLGSFAGSMIASMPQYAQESYLQNKQDLERELGRPLNQDENNKLVVSSLGTIGINSALNAIPVMHGLNRFNPAQVANKGFKAGAKNALAQILEEGATEAGEQTINELQKAYLGNSEGFQQALKNIGESGLAGGILGGIFGAGGNVVANTGKAQQPTNPQETQQLIQMMDAAKQQEVQPEQQPVPPTEQANKQVSEQVPEEEKKQVSAEIVGENAKYNPEPNEEDDEIAREVQEEFEQNSKSDIGAEKDIIYPDDKSTDKWGSIINTEENQEEQYEPNDEQTDWENEETIESHRQFKDAENKQILPEDLDNSLKDKKTANQKLIQLYNEAQDKDETSPEFQRYLDFQNKYNETFGKKQKTDKPEEGFTYSDRQTYNNQTLLDNEATEAKNEIINQRKDKQNVLKKRIKLRKELDKLINKRSAGKATQEDLARIDEIKHTLDYVLGNKQTSNSSVVEMPVKPSENENRINNTPEEKTLENEALKPEQNEYKFSNQVAPAKRMYYDKEQESVSNKTEEQPKGWDEDNILEDFEDKIRRIHRERGETDYSYGNKFTNKIHNKINEFLDELAANNFKKSIKKAEDAIKVYDSIPVLSDYSKYLKGYKFAVMKGRVGKAMLSINGSHNAKEKLILINREAIGNDLELAINTLAHEATHAKQNQEYNVILEKEKNGIQLTQNEEKFKNDYEYSINITGEFNNFRNENSEVISKISNKIREIGEANTQAVMNYYNSLGKNEKTIYNNYIKLKNLYETCSNEVSARQNGSKAVLDFLIKENEDARKNRYTERERNRRRKSINRRIFERPVQWRARKNGENGGNGLNSLQLKNIKIKNEWDYSYKNNEQQVSTNNTNKESQFKQTKSPSEHAHIRDRITKLAQQRRGVIDKGNYEASVAINKVTDKSKEIAKKYKKTDEKTVRELMTFLRECDESNISNAKKLLPKQSRKTDKFDYRALYRLHNKLSHKDLFDLKHTIDNASNELEQQWEQYKEYKDAYFEDKSEIGNASNYILHSWEKPKAKTEPIIGKRISKTSQSEKSRIFKTYKQGIDYVGENGEVVIPNTLDAAELLKMHSKDVMTKIANGKFAKILGNNVIVPNTEKGKIISYSYNPEFKKPLEAVLGSETQDVKEPTKARQAYRKVNNLFKRYAINIGSLFHHSTLSESRNSFGKGIEAILPTNAIKTQFNAIKSAFKDGDYEVFKRIPEAKEALKYGVKLGVTNDIDIESAIKDAEKIFGKKFGRVANKVAERMDKVLWDSLANTYKINTFNDLIDTYTKYYEDKKKGELPESVKRELAQFVNDSFGGQNYDTLQIKDSAVKTANDILLSTDWTLSTMIRQSASVLSSEKMQRWLNKIGESSKAGYELKELLRKAGIGSFTNDIEAAGIRGKAARIMFAKALVQAQIREKFMTGLNLLICYALAKDSDDEDDKPTAGEFFNYNNQFDREFLNYLFPDYFIGKDDKKIYNEDGEETGEVEHNAGKEMYVKQGKQFKEIPELVQGGLQYFGWNLMDRMASKMSPLISGLATKGAGTLADKYGDEFVKNKYGWKKDIKKRIPFTDFEYDSAIPVGMPFALNNIDKKSNKANKLVASIYSGVKEPNSYQASDEIMKKLMKGDSNIQTEKFSKKLRRNGLKDSDFAYDRMVRIAVKEALENKNSRVNTNGDVRRRFFKALIDYGFDDYDIQEFKDGNYGIYGEEE